MICVRAIKGGVTVEKIKLTLPLIVEGKYDKNTLSQIFDGVILTTDGFGVFNSKEKQALIRRLGAGGIILLTDSDGGGKQIRSFINGILPKDKIHNLYIPKIPGKERRKTAPSRAGLLGVEGMDRQTLTRVLSPFIESGERVEKNSGNPREMLTKVDFYLDGLSGGEDSARRRARLAESYLLPSDMTAKALLEALNLISSKEEYKQKLKELPALE